MLPLLHKLNLKSLSEPICQISKMAALLPPGHCTIITAEISRIFVFGARMRHFCENMMSLSGIPCQNLGKLPENRNFGRFRPVMCMPINKLNVMIPVLLKTSFKYRFHPPCPPYPTPFPHPSCSHPLAPFHNPFPQQFCPPCQK